MRKIGDTAPDFSLDTLDGQRFTLSETLAGGHPVLLVFLRHLG